jgi:hypothetical protein
LLAGRRCPSRSSFRHPDTTRCLGHRGIITQHDGILRPLVGADAAWRRQLPGRSNLQLPTELSLFHLVQRRSTRVTWAPGRADQRRRAGIAFFRPVLSVGDR